LNCATANGFRKLYIAKYVENAMITANVANTPGDALASHRVIRFEDSVIRHRR
jgi:hypothetical protein